MITVCGTLRIGVFLRRGESHGLWLGPWGVAMILRVYVQVHGLFFKRGVKRRPRFPQRKGYVLSGDRLIRWRWRQGLECRRQVWR